MNSRFLKINGHTILSPQLADDPPAVVDLGANRGAFSFEMEKKYKGSYVLVEANPGLAREVARQQNFRVIHCAVNDSEGMISFNIARNDEGSSILSLPNSSPYNCLLKETVEVPSRTVESLIMEFASPRIDILKMDIEGAEGRVIRSMSPSRLRTIGQITVEFHAHENFGFDLKSDTEEAVKYLRCNGFICLDFSKGSQIDTLFLNRSLLSIGRIQGMFWVLRLNVILVLDKIRKNIPASIKHTIRRLVE